MNRLSLCFIWAAIILPTAACNKSANADSPSVEGRNDMVDVSKDDAAMNAAIAEAKNTLPTFLAILNQNGAKSEDISFKYPLGGWEHIWVGDVKAEGTFLTGTLSNEPEQEGYKFGQEVRVPISEVSDWAYRDEKGVMRGHYTTKVLLPKLEAEEAASIRESFGW